uniref:TF-B3 domain-containing protein n=1 Tax=Nelumbo nucifera TaxID=4432 RepID=A0A822ZMS6_NELNU|nr:TPA_asm: hypothetical protein HUJ06_002486 [Nelumbo nucifera]
MAAARIRPRIPHFFQFIHRLSHSQEISMPAAFLRYLTADKCEKGEAVLRSRLGETWRVKLNGLRFQQGWEDFARHHDLRVGDFLVFRHGGGLVFDVLVFDTSMCEREYPLLSHVKQEDHTDEEMEETRMKEEAAKDIQSKQKATRIPISSKAQKKIAYSATKHPFFVAKVTPYSLKKQMAIPLAFARSKALRNCSQVTIKDESGRSWPVKVNRKSNGRAYFGAGWVGFSAANGLKKGDVCAFELTSGGKLGVMEFHLL